MELAATPIQRHKTAIRRPSYSLPVKCLLRDGLLSRATTLFDYGCGHGQDLELLRDMEILSEGWDPVHRPDVERTAADIVNLGYVINVIENPAERADALRQAWALCRSLLVVAAQLDFVAPDKALPTLNDGLLTSRGTFQKYYTQAELRGYLEEQLGADAIPAAPGVFYLFKDETGKQQFLVNRYRRLATVPTNRVSELLYEQNQELLDPFIQVLTRLGRLPGPDELPEHAAIVERLGSIKRAFALVQRVTNTDPWRVIAKRRAEDLLVYLALARFHRRPAFSELPLPIQRDVKAFYGAYQRACAEADALLFRAGDAAAIDQACCAVRIGCLVDNALLVKSDTLPALDPLLRVYEGCARALVGEVEKSNVTKLHRHSGKVSYLIYRDFEPAGTPTLQLRIKVSLRTLDIDFFDYSKRTEQPAMADAEQNALL